MSQNVYDQAARYTAKLDSRGFLTWLLRCDALHFRGWLDTRRLPFPGETDRTCDTVAHLEHPATSNEHWAVPVEFQLEPDASMDARLLIYLGQLLLEQRRTTRDRWCVGAVIVNLTGSGGSSMDVQLSGTCLRMCLQMEERNLRNENAAATLDGIAAGALPMCLLPWVPLMHGGGESSIIHQWLALASAEPDARRRGDYGGLALVFSEAAGCRDAWKQGLKGWNMVQSMQVLEWKAEAKAEDLVRLLELRFSGVAADLRAAIEATTDIATLERWFDIAAVASSEAAFRQASGL